MRSRIGILTVSDRASRGEYEDRGGPAIREWLDRVLCSEWAACAEIVPDETDCIKEALMRTASLRVVPTAILSRQIAGMRGQSLIINLPGKPSAVADCLNAVFPAVPYCIDLMGGPRLEAHAEQCEVFRPKK
jgi:molybdopterin adenylyltransferase